MPTDHKRRRFLETAAAAGILGVAGCSGQGGEGTGTPTDTPVEQQTVSSEEKENYEPVKQIELMTFTRDFAPLRFQAVSMVKDAWEKLGVSVKIQALELGALFDKYNSGNYDASLMWFSTGADRAAPYFFISIFRSDDSNNAANFSNSEYDDVANQALTTFDREESKGYVDKAQEILSRQQPVMWLLHTRALHVVNPNLFEGYTPWVGNSPFYTAPSLAEISPKTDDKVPINAAPSTSALDSNMNPMNPVANADQTAMRLIWDRLYRVNKIGEPIPWAATGHNWADDTTLDVELREGMTWHDGEAVTPEDVKFTIDYMTEWEVPKFKTFYGPVDNVELPGGNTVRFNLKRTMVSFVAGPLTRLWILPKHIWDGIAEEKGLDHPRNWVDGIDRTGSGPFKFVRYEEDNVLEYELYDDHFMADEYEIDGLIKKLYGTQTTAVGAVENGDAAYTMGVQPQQYERAKSIPSLKPITSPSYGWTGIYMNNEQAPFNDPAFRRAVAHTVDQERIINLAFSGFADVARSPISPSNKAWFNPDAPLLNGGLNTAKKELIDAGYRWDENGRLLKPIN